MTPWALVHGREASTIQKKYEPDATMSIFARRYGIHPNQLFTWRNLARQVAFTAAAAQEDVARRPNIAPFRGSKNCSACLARRR